MKRALLGVLVLVLVVAAAAVGWAAFAPLPQRATREEAFVIPEGTWARRMAGERVEILPQRIDLTLGVNDVLLLVNRDTVPQTFGPTLLMPGQRFRLPFEQAADYQFACTAHASGQMTIAVAAYPRSPWARLRWRAQRLQASLHRAPPATH